jgi:Ca-activated chloride channel family protein
MWAIEEKRTNCTNYMISLRLRHRAEGQNGQTFAQDRNPSFVRTAGYDRAVSDKHLTWLAETCDNILRNYEDYMARQSGRGSSRPWASIRFAPHVGPSALSAVTCLKQPFVFLIAIVSVLLLGASLALAQESDVQDIHISPRIEAPKAPSITEQLGLRTPLMKSKVDLVLVPVTVTDPMNRLVTGLDKENFQVFEGKEQQEVRNFSSEDAPVSIGIIFDMSGSMGSKIERAREAVSEFLKTANPQDEYFMITFADKPEEISDFTSSVDDLQNKLIFTQPKGRTALLDAIYLGLSKMRQAKYPKKALLIISDGGDNHSRYTEGEIKGLVKEADVMIYSIGIYDHYFQTEEERLGPALLSDISDLSGGRSFTIDNPNDLADVATKIGIELRNQYVLGYRPKNPGHDGKWHKIKVKLLPPKGLPPLHVYARTGYYASSQ